MMNYWHDEVNINPWQSAYELFRYDTLPKLKRIGKDIGRKAKENDLTACEIIKYYSMLKRSFDPLTLIMLNEAIEKFEAIP